LPAASRRPARGVSAARPRRTGGGSPLLDSTVLRSVAGLGW